MTVFYRENQRRISAQQDAIAKKVEDGKMKPETAIKKSAEIDTQEKTVDSGTARGTMKIVQKWRVIDKSKIPYHFMEPNMVAIKAAFKEGQPVPGVEQYQEEELAIS